MLLVLATSNIHKQKEIQAIFQGSILTLEIRSFSDFIPPFEIEENGLSFKQNATIKAKAMYEALQKALNNQDFLILSEDSGLCIDALSGNPGIYSARFNTLEFGDNSWRQEEHKLQKLSLDSRNLKRVIYELTKQGLQESKAYFVANICLMGQYNNTKIHKNFEGICEGKVITQEYGNRGFGYDPIFIPKGYDKTLAQIESKNDISHRRKALNSCLQYLQKIMET